MRLPLLCSFIGLNFLLTTVAMADCPASGSALSINGQSMSASDCHITTTDSFTHGVTSHSGTIELKDSTIKTSGYLSNGVYADGNQSHIHLNNVGIHAANGNGLSALFGAHISMTGGTVTSNGMYTNGIEAINGGLLDIDTVQVRTTSSSNLASQAIGVFAHTGGAAFSTTTEPTNAVHVANSDIVVTGANASGVFAMTGSTIDLTNTSTTVNGQGGTGAGALATNGGAINIANNSQVLTTGNNTSGIVLRNTSSATLLQSSVQTTGDSSYGASVQSGSNLIISQSAIVTDGTNAHGVFIDGSTNGSVAWVDSSSIKTSNTNSAGIALTNGATVVINNSNIATSGINSSALQTSAISDTSILNVSNSNLTADQAPLINVTQGNSSIQLNNVSGNAASGQNFVTVGSTSTAALTFVANNSVLSGDINVADGSSAVVTFANNSQFTGSIDPASVVLDASSTWNLTASSIVDDFTNAGTVNFVPSGTVFKTLTIDGSYVGQNGSMIINTFLQGNGSPSDLIIINGGTASGTTTLHVRNAMGGGALTTGNGILVVNAASGGTIPASAFVLANEGAIAGPYEYTLHQGTYTDPTASDDFYLRSSTYNPSTGAFVPNYRPEVSLYTATPSMMLLYGRSMVDSFHQRVGAEETVDPVGTQHFKGAWSRIINQGGNIDNGNIFNNGPDFNYHFLALQLGTDIYHREYTSGHRDFSGIYVSMGDGSGDVEHYTGINAGTAGFHSYGFGAYWTHFGPNDWYIDGVVQTNWFKIEDNSAAEAFEGSTTDYVASLEGGYPIKLTPAFKIEPEAQVIYQSLTPMTASDTAATVHFNSAQSLASRLGIRFAWDWFMNPSASQPRKINVWFTASTWHDSRGNSTDTFSSAAGPVAFHSTVTGSWGEGDLGMTAELTRELSLFGTLSEQIYYNGRGRSYSAIGGLRVNLS